MIPIPIGTDAPLYHYPITTIGLIVVNVICFILSGFGHPQIVDPWVLHFGTINPIEWISCMFAHAGIGHIVGNMFFLWGFGLIVEGKLGWAKTLGLYLAIGTTQAAFIQVIMLPWKGGGALGASSAIMGLMAISLVWAPKNNLNCFWVFWFWWIVRVKVFEVTVMMYAVLYLGWNLLTFIIFDQAGMGTSALHLSGAMIGFGAGVLFLKRGWVDCENWDLFRVLSGKYGRDADPMTAVGSHADPTFMFGHKEVVVPDDIEEETHRSRMSKQMQKICKQIDSGSFIEASEKVFELRMQDDSPLPESHLKRLAIGLQKANMSEDAEMYLEEYIEQHPDKAAWARIRLAQILLTERRRPNAALAILKKVRLSQVSADQQTLAKKIASTAKKLVKQGVQDAEPEW